MRDKKKILIEVSNRHVHFSREDLNVLFGKNFKLVPIRELSQPGQFVSNNRVHLTNGKNKLEKVRVLGPERSETQIEISKSDALNLGIDVPLRHSGDLEGSPGIEVVGPAGTLNLKKGVILSQRHLHASYEEADEIGIKHNEKVSIKVNGLRNFILENVFIRVGSNHRLALHIDRDDAELAGIERTAHGELV